MISPIIEVSYNEREYAHDSSTRIVNPDPQFSESGFVEFAVDIEHAQQYSVNASVSLQYGIEQELEAAVDLVVAEVGSRANISSQVTAQLGVGLQTRESVTIITRIHREYELPPCHSRTYDNIYTRYNASFAVWAGDLVRCLKREQEEVDGEITTYLVIHYCLDGAKWIESSGDGAAKLECIAGPYIDDACRDVSDASDDPVTGGAQ
ncbi:MAG: hypothetical protein Tsb0013_24790 [Phycisphaerales bacterium]